MSYPGKWAREVHDKARVIHSQIAVLQQKASESGELAPQLEKIFCEPYFRLLEKLYNDELPWALAMDDSDIVLRLRGPAADETAPRVKLIADTFDEVRQQVQNIARALAGVAHSTAAKFAQDLDIGLSGFARGSIIIGLKVRGNEGAKQASLLDDSDPLLLATRQAVRLLGEVPRYISESGIDQRFNSLFDDPGLRDAILVAATQLAPTGQRGIDQIDFAVPDSPSRRESMTAKTRILLRQSLARPVKQSRSGSFQGVVRELDLDLKRFELRQMSAVPSLRCVYSNLSDQQARTLLDSLVEVSGFVELSSSGVPRLMQVESVRLVDDAPLQLELSAPLVSSALPLDSKTITLFRKRKGGDTWHFCKNCSQWPTDNYKEQSTKPTTGEFCNECRAKQKAGNCK